MIRRGHDGEGAQAALSDIRAALFILATILLAVSGAIFSASPMQTHGIPLGLDDLRLQQLSLAGNPTHRLEIGRDGQMAFDGGPLCDLIDLRQRLDFIMIGREPLLEVMPDPELRYETFVEIMGVVGRASVRNVRVDLQPDSARDRQARLPAADCRERYVL